MSESYSTEFSQEACSTSGDQMVAADSPKWRQTSGVSLVEQGVPVRQQTIPGTQRQDQWEQRTPTQITETHLVHYSSVI